MVPSNPYLHHQLLSLSTMPGFMAWQGWPTWRPTCWCPSQPCAGSASRQRTVSPSQPASTPMARSSACPRTAPTACGRLRQSARPWQRSPLPTGPPHPGARRTPPSSTTQTTGASAPRRCCCRPSPLGVSRPLDDPGGSPAIHASAADTWLDAGCCVHAAVLVLVSS